MDKKVFNKEIAKSTAFDMVVSGFESLVANGGRYLLENSGIVGDVAMDTGASMIPGIGNAISSFRQNRKIDNIEKLTKNISDDVELLKQRVSDASEKDKENYMELIDYAYDSVELYSQKEKIDMLSNGLINIIKTDDISFDISYLYINTLNRLSLLDLAVVKLYNNQHQYIDDSPVEFESYRDILDRFGIEYEQYEAIRGNLNTLGLLETQTDQSLNKDLDTIEKQIERIDKNSETIIDDLDKLVSGKLKRVSKLKYERFKIKSKDMYRLSKFGRDFYRHFLNTIE
ncbi:hypothetical protein ACRCJU_01845 [Aerococcus urinaeequi]|uniref:hypothetical protein n=1 Tax=Aerococcus urinaeequi TaxID=51665 RepID=UPI003D6B18BF